MYKEGKNIEEIMKWSETEVDHFAQYFLADDFKFFDGFDWSYNPDGYVRLCNENEVNDFLEKILS